MLPSGSPAGTPTMKTTSAWRPEGWVAALGATLAAAAAAAYSGTFAVPMVFDDRDSILSNPTLRHLVSAFFPPAESTVGGRPLLNVTLALNHAVSGTEVWSYHATNLAIHVLAGLTLLGILRRALAPRGERQALLVAFSAALLWTLHPLQTESVTYIIQRAESLMGLLYLLTLYCFIRGAERQGPGPWFILSIGACLLGMATKEVMASAPLIVLLYDRTFIAGSFSEAWRRRRGVYAGLAATWLLLGFLILSAHGRGGTAGLGSGVSWWSYALTQFPAIVHYLRLSLLPHPLVLDYGTALETRALRIVPGLLFVAALLAATVWALFRRGALGARDLSLAWTGAPAGLPRLGRGAWRHDLAAQPSLPERGGNLARHGRQAPAEREGPQQPGLRALDHARPRGGGDRTVPGGPQGKAGVFPGAQQPGRRP